MKSSKIDAPTKKSSSRKRRAALKGSGDYTTENSIREPMARLEAKLDHIEKSVNKVANPKTIASTAGRALGSLVGMGDLGGLAGETIAKLFGHGDFEVKSNSIMKGVEMDGPVVPKFTQHGKRGTRIVEREYLGDIVSGALVGGATAFTNTAYAINPTNAQAFPWLSTVAQQFDQWEPHGMVFEFVSTSSEYNGASQALGTVIMSTDYDSLDLPFTSKQTMENADYACSTKPSVSLIHGIECDVKERPLPVMYTGSHASVESRFQVLGNFQIATMGCSVAGVTLGELWVSYDITFYKKQITPPPYIGPGLSQGGTSVLGSGLFSNPTVFQYQKLLTIDNGTSPSFSLVRFDPSVTSGYFLVYYSIATYHGEPYTWPVPTGSVGCAMVSESGFPSPAVVGASYDRSWLVQVLGFIPGGAYFTMTTQLVAGSYWQLCISQVPSQFALSH